MYENAFALLNALEWLPAQSVPLTSPIHDWLMEKYSMTRRLERHCNKVIVKLIYEGFINAAQLNEEKTFMPQDQRYWLREVVLTANGIQPLLAGRTVVPESTLEGRESEIQILGNRPLGDYLFSSASLSRDFIQPGVVQSLWGRRSLLRLTDKPLLLTELFLPAAPLYRNLSAEGSI